MLQTLAHQAEKQDVCCSSLTHRQEKAYVCNELDLQQLFHEQMALPLMLTGLLCGMPNLYCMCD